MMELLAALRESALATWVRESPSVFAYPLFLTLHTIGLGLLVGTTAGISLRLLGVASSLPLGPLATFFRLAWVGFWINALSGIVLLAAEPTAFLTHPAFYVKLGAIALAVAILPRLRRAVVVSGPLAQSAGVPPRAKGLPAALLVLWTVAITAGRVTSYTGAVGLATAGAVLVAGGVLLAGRYALVHARPKSARRPA